MKRFLKLFIDGCYNVLHVLITGGKYGSYATEQPSDYAKRQEQRRKDFAKFGGRECKICGIRIPANKYYCAPCWGKYVKK